jgi:hypothetical protein
MKEIGGFFELELGNRDRAFHSNLLALNTGRNAFEYILRVRGYKKVFMPAYYCDVLLEPLQKLGIAVEHYPINYDLEFEPFQTSDGEAILCINYFGIKDKFIKKVVESTPRIIVDNTQAFFSPALPGIDTFYSCRKFFGVPDGSYVSIDKMLEEPLEHDNSAERYRHLVGRIDASAQDNYGMYQAAEHGLENQPIKLMSPSTKRVLANVDCELVTQRRQANFWFLHGTLGSKNRLQLPVGGAFLCYPILLSEEVKHKLVVNKVYTPTYWPNVLKHAAPDSVEYDLAKNLVCIPIDQRYDLDDMKRIVQIIEHD